MGEPLFVSGCHLYTKVLILIKLSYIKNPSDPVLQLPSMTWLEQMEMWKIIPIQFHCCPNLAW